MAVSSVPVVVGSTPVALNELGKPVSALPVFVVDENGQPAGASSSAYLGPVASAGYIPNANVTANKQGMWATPHMVFDNVSSVKLAFPGFFVAGSGFTEAALGASPVTIEASIEYPTNTFTRVTFGGANQGALTQGSLIWSDNVPINILRGTVPWVRTWYSCADGIIFTTTPGYQNKGAFGVATPNLVMGGVITASSGAGYGPCAIIGSTRRPTVALIGDSRVAGYGDTPDETINMGSFARSVGQSLAYINLGVSGDRLETAKANYTKRGELASYCSHILSNLGGNDIGGWSRTPAQAHADLQTLLGLSAFAGKQWWHATAEPFLVTSSDSYATEANQTVGAETTDTDTFNNTLRGGVAKIAGVIDVASIVESATTAGKWQAPKGQALTGDGTHPNRRGYLKIQSSGIIQPGMFQR